MPDACDSDSDYIVLSVWFLMIYVMSVVLFDTPHFLLFALVSRVQMPTGRPLACVVSGRRACAMHTYV
jgi:hypothetical protein